MKTFTGLNKETECACGCQQRMPANPAIQVVVDMDSHPWKRYIPGHEPRSSRSYRGKGSYGEVRAEPKETQKPAVAPTPAPPAPSGPAPTPPVPSPDTTPSPSPKPGSGVPSTLADNHPWAIVVVTASAGPYETIKVGVADFGADGESLGKLRERVAAEVAQELDRQVRALQILHGGKPTSPTQGAVSAPVTLSPAAAAGAPANGSGVTHVGPEMMEARRQVSMEMDGDASAVRSVKKRHAAKVWLKAHGYESFDQVLPSDLGALKELLAQFEVINYASETAVPRTQSERDQHATPAGAGVFR